MKKALSWLDVLLLNRVRRTQVDAMNLALVCQNMDRYVKLNERHNQLMARGRQTCALLK